MGRERPLRVGISACLLGQEVRFDGGHKRNAFLTDVLGPFVEWVPICPEVEMGLGTPRETLRLERVDGALRIITTRTRVDHTDGMNRWARARLAALAAEDLSGYVLKKDSPSCGLMRVKLYGNGGVPSREGRGVFAAALVARFPSLPVEEEGRLSDPRLRENFIERLFAFRRLKDLFAERWTPDDLVRFHTAQKMALLAHSTTAYRALGRLVAEAGRIARSELRGRYESQFMATLAILATPQRHANVLTHMAGHLKRKLDTASRHELATLIDDYRRGLVPLVVPVTLIRHHVRVHGVSWLADQVYLQPHPRELLLRNHV
jgi:uncharacterized protein YbgA (DUF1722 family)/uncharacterized protein YbbK (DUF523 family)